MSNGYRVERLEHGIVITGQVPIGDMCTLLMRWGDEDGFDLCDELIAAHLGAAMVVTTKARSQTWRNQLGVPDPSLNNGEGCPGAGKCHGIRSWCQRCGNVELMCDDPACDMHKERRRAAKPKPKPKL